jgi:hypothetical protein
VNSVPPFVVLTLQSVLAPCLIYVVTGSVWTQPETLDCTLGHRPAISPVCLFCTTTAASLPVGTNEQMLVDTRFFFEFLFLISITESIQGVIFQTMCICTWKGFSWKYYIFGCFQRLNTLWQQSLINSVLMCWKSTLILFCHLRFDFPVSLFSSDLGTNVFWIFSLFVACYMSHLSHHPQFHHPFKLSWTLRVYISSPYYFLHAIFESLMGK